MPIYVKKFNSEQRNALKVIIFFLALSGLFGCGETEVDEPVAYSTESHFDYPTSLGLDADGFLAVCTDEGIAQSISRDGDFRTIEPRLKSGEFVRCMNKDKAKRYMASLEADSATTSYVLEQYPEIALAQ